MPSPNPLQQLHGLDRSSPEFPCQLTGVLLGEDFVDCVQNPPCEDLGPFVEYFDSVLDDLDHTDCAFHHCLFELRRICGANKVLPTSHVLSDALLRVSDRPTASGTLADTHDGTLEELRVRVKKMRIYSKEDPMRVKMFYQEAVVWKRMDHPNIIPFCGVTLDPPQLVSSWMQGGDLTEYINKHPESNRFGLLCDIAEGLNYLHSCNVVHGNMKGANILVDHFGRARIANFALAGPSDDQGPYCIAEVEDYNTQWTAPEVLEGTGPPTKEADIFSFGMIMIEAFTGTVPFNHLPVITSVVEIMEGERPPRPNNPTFTDDAWILMQRCWDQEPRSRPGIREVLQDLVSSLLWSLYQFTKSSPKFQVALSQFYDSTEHNGCVNHLDGAELKEFVNFLDEVLRTEGLSEGLLEKTLHILQDVFDDWTVHPGSHTICHEFSKSTVNPHAVKKYAEVWRGQFNFGEASNRLTDACLKAIKIEKVHKGFCGEVVAWAKLDHPNILQCFSVTVDPFQIVTEWMSNGQAMEYARAHPDVDRIRLLIDVAEGLTYLHSHGVVHGNLKQQNILVDSAGRARLSDIGFATLTHKGGSQFDWANVGADGHRWAAPEIFKSGELSQQSDVFSYGFIAAEIFVGELLWEEIDAGQVKSKIVNGERPRQPEGQKRRTLTTELWRIFTKCWGTVPERRISASEVLSVLQYVPRPRSGGSYGLETVAAHGKAQASQEQINNLDKVLETNMISCRERPEFLTRLCKMCGLQRSLPTSMVILVLDRISIPAMYGGGFADVYRGEYKGRSVAIKVPRLYTCNDRDLDLSRFCREAVVWRHLRHPNILPLLGATLEADKFAFVSEWMDNGNINAFIQKHADVNRVELLVDVAHGLEYLHGLNFIHGDLKGANILIKKDHRACLADFGLSTIGYAPSRLSADIYGSPEASSVSLDSKVSLLPHLSGGTAPWMSPELLYPKKYGLKECRPTKPSDCYALGMVIYEVLCGQQPYWDHNGNTIQAILEGVRPRKPDDAAALGFTDGLWWTIECCWMTDCGIRPNVKTVLSHLTHATSDWGRG